MYAHIDTSKLSRDDNRAIMATDTLRIPRLGVTVERKFVDRAIVESIGGLGYDKPREYQVDVILQFVSGRDTFVSMPTGSGKSVCFASTRVVFDKLRRYCTDALSTGVSTHHCITVIVSPLTALMQDQVSRFRLKGLKAAYVGGEEEKEFDGVVNGLFQLMGIHPHGGVNFDLSPKKA